MYSQAKNYTTLLTLLTVVKIGLWKHVDIKQMYSRSK